MALALMLLVAGCADSAVTAPVTPPQAAASAPKPATGGPVAGGIVLHPQNGEVASDNAGGVALTNDPSAPADTPLCGVAAKETNAIGQTVLSRQYASAGICSSFACYDPATATYTGSDGYRHVCR